MFLQIQQAMNYNSGFAPALSGITNFYVLVYTYKVLKYMLKLNRQFVSFLSLKKTRQFDMVYSENNIQIIKAL